MLVSQNEGPDYRQPRSPAHQPPPLPGTNYTPPMYQHHHNATAAPYSPHLTNSPMWSPNSSVYLTPLSNGSPSSGYASSVYSTPVGSSPCRNSGRYPVAPGTSSSTNNSPMRYRPVSGYHPLLHPDRLHLHIEGQSSLV